MFRDPTHPQRLGVEQCLTGAVLVMDSRGNARAASAGDILVTRLQMRGLAGVVTDGGFRDSMAIGELDIPAYHQRPSSPTNLTLHQASRNEAVEMTLFERFVINEVRAGKSIIGLYPAIREQTRIAFEAWRSAPDRSSGSR